jgi:hypothetical protein
MSVVEPVQIVISRRMLALSALLVCVFAGWLAFVAAPALAGEPQWTVNSVSRPTNFAPGDTTGDDAYLVTVTNTGSGPSDGSPITITDELPGALAFDPAGATGEDVLAVTNGSGDKGLNFTCVLNTCTYAGVVVPDDTLVVRFPVDVLTAEPGTALNVVHVAGGGAPGAGVQTATKISAEPASFGISPGGASTSLSSVQAGAHPDLTTSIAFNTINSQGSLAGDPKDTTDDLPPGFALDLPDTSTCQAAAFLGAQCPVGSQVGVIVLTLTGQLTGNYLKPVYNLAPGPGEAAKLGFAVGTELFFQADLTVRPGDYGGRAVFHNINQNGAELDNVALTVWGVPASPIHDPLRFVSEGFGGIGSFGAASDAAPAPFFTNATSCGTEPLQAVFSVTSWQHPNASESPAPVSMQFGPLVGCYRLGMAPSLLAEPTSSRASAPTGLNVTTGVPQTFQNAEGLSTSTLRGAVVTLPAGMTVNPSAGAGLEACSPAQYAEEGAVEEQGKGCPNASKLGSVKIDTPLLKEEALGSVYVAQPYDNPFGSLLALYVVARIPDRGIVVKVAGEVSLNPLTGQLTTTFDTTDPAHPHDGLPPLPFTSFTLGLRQGETSPLVTPPACGQYTVQAKLTPLATPAEALSVFSPAFSISSGFDGGACPAGGTPPFAPQVQAGMQGGHAGTYNPLYIRVIRGDGEQEITRFSSHLPPGLTANLSGVPFCSDASLEQAKGKTGAQEEAEPSCPAASQIGHTLVGAGVGSVLAEAPGKIYMAGPYHGAPFSIVSITAAKVGPFDLGTVVLRFALEIDPTTAAVTVDASASDPIPHIIKGIVIHVRDIRVYVDRPNYTLNPTNCSPQVFSATVTGAGADPTNPADEDPVTVNDPFQVSNCATLGFKPSFKATTTAKTSRANGTSLKVALAYPIAPQGTQANISAVKVDLPRQLPSRLTTLQKACPDKVFDSNPGGCPSASRIGTATAVTPILPVPLSGPVYFVSHAARSFPDLVIVLQGYGVTIDLRGETFISKKSITSTTFRTIPDQPVTSFSLTLPQGRYSALASNGNLCKVKGGLIMPTALTAQNGLTIHQSTKIGVSGCPKQKAAAHRKKSAHAKKR